MPEKNSSIFQKLDSDQRRKLDHAIIDRDPPTLKAVYEKFQLAELEVSRAAFYRYARRRRSLIATRDFAELALPEEAEEQIPDMMPSLIAHRLLDALADESTSPRTITSLVNAWRTTVQIRNNRDIHRQRLTTEKDRKHNREMKELNELLRQYTKVVREEQHNRATQHGESQT